MRISDWSSDVCSSDLRAQRAQRRAVDPRQHVAGVRLVGELQVRTVVAAVELVAASQQVLVEPLQRLLQHAVGNHETALARVEQERSEEHTSELQSLMRISYAVSCLKKKTHPKTT